MSEHEHEWERGPHMAEAFGVDGRRLACAICGEPKQAAGVPAMTGEDRTVKHVWRGGGWRQHVVRWGGGWRGNQWVGYRACSEPRCEINQGARP